MDVHDIKEEISDDLNESSDIEINSLDVPIDKMEDDSTDVRKGEDNAAPSFDATDIDPEHFDYDGARQPDGRYQCPMCDRSLADVQTMRLHLRLHIGSAKLKRCDICQRGFAKRNHLQKHMASHAKGEFKCPHCAEVFESKYDRRMHFNSEHSRGVDARSSIKPARYDDELNVSVNVGESVKKLKQEEVTIENQTIAKQAPAKLLRSKLFADFKYNQSRQPDGRYQCPMCERSLADAPTLKQHMRLHTGKGLKHCEVCNRGFAKQNHLTRHMATHKTGVFECGQCSQWFKSKYERRLHYNAGHKETKSKPDDEDSDGDDIDPASHCSVDVDGSQSDENPVEVTEVEPKNTALSGNDDKDGDGEYFNIDKARQLDGRYQCPVCSRSLADAKTLKLHLRLHSGKGLKHCEICNRGFVKQNHLTRHMASHAKRKYPCEYCPEIFGSPHERRIHFTIEHGKSDESKRGKVTIATTNGPKVCQCRICDLKFDRILALREHIQMHADDEQSLANIDWSEKKNSLFSGTSFENENLSDVLLRTILKTQIQNNEQVFRFYQITTESGYEMSLSDTETETEDEESVVKWTKPPSERNTCISCKKSFARSFQIINHMKLHPIKSVPIQFHTTKCHSCEKYFPNLWHLERHQRSQCQNEVKHFHCIVCDYRFMWKSSFDQHMKAVHAMRPPKVNRRHECDFCGKLFQRHEHLDRHRKIHIPAEKRYECDICKKAFTRKDNLR